MLGATRVAFIGAAGRRKYVLLYVQTFEGAGSTYYTVPQSGNLDIEFEIWGGGGGGGGKYSTVSGRVGASYGGGGGGGGGYAQHKYSSNFTSGDRINMIVGNGGVGGKYITNFVFYPGATGGQSELISHSNSSGTTISTITAYATGGLGGLSNTTSYGGTGGIGYGSGVTLSGFNGTNGGINANGGTGGDGASGGAGGLGAKALPQTAGQAGTPPAGGGGGAAYGGIYDDGEDGAVGRIIVRVYGYEGYVPPSQPTLYPYNIFWDNEFMVNRYDEAASNSTARGWFFP